MAVLNWAEHWEEAMACIEARDWHKAEQLLLALQGLANLNPVPIADALAYCQLEQAQYQACLNTLEPVLEHPDRHFWLAHKAGDAWRGLGELEHARWWYEQAIRDGSSSPITYRNLLQLEADRTMDCVNHWLIRLGSSPELAWVAAAREVAALQADVELATWLHQQQLADSAVQQLMVEQRLRQLDLSVIRDLNNQDGWQNALLERLGRLKLAP